MHFKLISNCKFQTSNSQSGFVVSISTFFTLVIMLSIGISMSSLIAYRQKSSTNSVKSTQSYYAAEAGAEDALIRLKNNPSLAASSYVLEVGGASTNVVIPGIVGGTRVITSQGNHQAMNRKIQVVYAFDGDGIGFYYGAQVGAGGLQMSNGTRIVGSVYSNGNITGSGTIDSDAIVAGNGNAIDGPSVGGNVLAARCNNSVVAGNLTYVTGGANTCMVGGSTSTQSTEIAAQPLPISQAQINAWKDEAFDGGTSGDVTINGAQTLGPQRIAGTLTLSNNATLNVTGTLHVMGNIILGNGARVKLDSSYGSTGGVVVTDGVIDTGNNSTFTGTGQVGSYILMLSTNVSDEAIKVTNNASGVVFYTSAGGIDVSNNVQVQEITGYKLFLKNNAVIQYDSGLANAFFSSGPGGGWKVTSWEEK